MTTTPVKTLCEHCSRFNENIACPCAEKNYYQVRDNWQGDGYRLYYGDDHYVTQIDGEINGQVFRTIQQVKAYCLKRFGAMAVRTT